jgi:P4 family phage/plasmid primase-like protien
MAIGAREKAGDAPGKWELSQLPDLELRVGSYGADGVIKQFQSVVPPTPGTDKKPREWNSVEDVARLPEAAYVFLESLARRNEARAAREEHAGGNGQPQDGEAKGIKTTEVYPEATIEERARRYARTIDPAISGQHGHDKTFYAACKIGPGFDLPRDLALRIIAEEYNPRCQPPWSQSELEHKIDDAYANESERGRLLNAEPQNGNARGGKPGNLDAQLACRPATDTGNGERMAARHGDKIRYCHPWSKWLVYDGCRWKLDNTAAVRRLAKDSVRRIYAEASTLADEEKRKALVAWGLKSESRDRISAMLDLASTEDRVPILADQMDQDGWLFNCPNGTVDLKTGNLRPPRRTDFLTQLCPVNFDPAAEAPLWNQTLHLFFNGDEDLIDYWQRICGYALVGVIRDHVMPIAYGTGANGKSTILGTLLGVFGSDYGMKCPPDMLMAKKWDSHPTDRADLFRKRLVVAIETEAGRRLNETMVKELTGGDRIRTRRMREDFWEFSPTHTLVMATNHKPVIRGTDRGIWRRLRLVPFSISVEGSADDRDMPAKLLGELPGVLAWCVRGCLKWQEKGLEEPQSVKEATSGYRGEQDLIGAFLAEHTLQNPQFRVRCGVLYERFKKWAEAGNEHVMTMRSFGETMRERGIETVTSNGKWYTGIGLQVEASDSDDWTMRAT